MMGPMASRDEAGARRDRPSVARAVLVFAASGMVALTLVGVGGVLVLRRIATSESYREAEKLATVASRIVERRLGDGILTGAVDGLLPLDALVNGGVLTDPIVRVKILDSEGRILYYSDAPELIGTAYPLDESELAALSTGDAVTEPVDPSLPENELESGLGPLLQVSLPVTTPGGHELLFQASLEFESVAASGRELWTAFLPVLAVALALLAAVQVPLAYRLARRVRRSQEERERLLRRAIEASNLERRRIAADLHEGLVQQLAGVSMALAAKADDLEPRDPAAAHALHESAAVTRQGVRSLRSALLNIYPPTLQRSGLRAALSDLAAPLPASGVEADIDVAADIALAPEVESLVFRTAQEAIRNVVVHARATRVRMRLNADGEEAVLEVEDDGVGFSDERITQARADGHIGLTLLDDLAHDVGGRIDVTSAPGGGTRVRLEVPVR
jgi:signal transduction histidine kinase